MNRFVSLGESAVQILRRVVVGAVILVLAGHVYASQYRVTITQPPQNITACEGQTVTLSVQATTDFPNAQFAYEWQKDNQTIQDGGKYSGATTNTLTISNISQAEAGQYTVIVRVTNPGSNVTPGTAIATVTVEAAPTIASQPQNVNGCEDDQASVSVQVSGAITVTYQWYVVGMGPIPGATSSTYEQQLTMQMNGIRVYCGITSRCGEIYSDTITVTVKPKTVITQQPTGGQVDRDGTIRLTVQATGSNLRYQWRKNGQNIGGATTNEYVISNFSSADVGDYDCVVTGDCGTVNSDIAPVRASTVEDAAYVAGYRLNVSPLPANENLTISVTTPQTEVITLELVDVTGRTIVTIWQGVSTGSQQMFEVNTATFNAGAYRCVLRSNRYHLTAPVVVVR